MKLHDALDLSAHKSAYAHLNIADQFFTGSLHAIGGKDGSVFIAESREDGRPRLGDMKPLANIPEPLRRVIEGYDTWEPRCPKHPLEALADAATAPLTIDSLFHRLWTKAVGTEGYNKREWRALQAFLEQSGSTTAPIGQYDTELGHPL